jgi:hypothetical protein
VQGLGDGDPGGAGADEGDMGQLSGHGATVGEDDAPVKIIWQGVKN